MCKNAHGGFALWLQSRHLLPEDRTLDEFAANSEGAKLQPYALLCFFERFIGGHNGYTYHGFNPNDGGIWQVRILLLVMAGYLRWTGRRCPPYRGAPSASTAKTEDSELEKFKLSLEAIIAGPFSAAPGVPCVRHGAELTKVAPGREPVVAASAKVVPKVSLDAIDDRSLQVFAAQLGITVRDLRSSDKWHSLIYKHCSDQICCPMVL